MGFHAAWERQETDGDIGDALVEIIPSLRSDPIGTLVEQTQNNGDIVRCKTPKNVFLPPNLTQIQPVRIDVLDAAQFTRTDQFFELQHRRVIPEKMPHHENAALLLCEGDKLFSLLDRKAEWLFHKHILAGQQGLSYCISMALGWRGNGHSPNRLVAQHFGIGHECPTKGILFTE